MALMDSIRGFSVDVKRSLPPAIYGFRLIVYDRNTGRKVSDRTFTASSENWLTLKLSAYITKKRLLRQFTPGKVKLRIIETSRHMVPLKMFAMIEKETNGKVFLHGNETEDSIPIGD